MDKTRSFTPIYRAPPRIRRSSMAGEAGLLIVMVMASIVVCVFFVVKDWIKDTKDARHGIGEYQYSRGTDGTTPVKEPTRRHYGSYYTVTY